MSLCGREAYKAELTALADGDPRIICLEADLGGPSHPFAERHPGRFLNLGIAEAAAVDMAVGLASAGLRPFLSTFAAFGTWRAAESVKLGLGYQGAPVVLVCPYGGVSGGWFGPTHHSLEDLAVAQSLPGVRIAVPCGEEETRAVIRTAAADDRPCYVRLARNEPFDAPFPPAGRGEVGWVHGPAGPTCLVSVGEKPAALCAAATEQRPELSHAHLCWVDAESLATAAAELAGSARRIVVVEEHRAAGGVASTLALMLPRHEVLGVNAGPSWPSEGGGHDDVLAALGLTVAAVLDAASAHAPTVIGLAGPRAGRATPVSSKASPGALHPSTTT
ncbi:transketolase [Sphaerisporangium melleum]|uniref:Transketolase n=1 Tax=Sphaerisporangium melleum TaxID=321316 RepID=A0A917VR19_9ACTN|nr:transketolase [Sphaerisporangium melleum]GGL05940.1 transketolase [Sphaerisporangium melleum]GII73138.1 transketolase [Sphaerisporangium melleum]